MRLVLASRVMSRTTLDLDSAVLQELRARGKREHKSMGQLASELLAAGLKQQAPRPAAPPRLPSWNMGKPLIDIDDKEALGLMLDREYMARLDR